MRSPFLVGALASAALLLAQAAPAAVLDITKAPYNAVGDGATDCTSAINHALADASKANPKAQVFVPAGIFAHADQLYATGVEFYGDGKTKSILRATNPQKSTVNLRGDSGSIHDLQIDCPTADKRLSCGWQTGITVAGSNFRVVAVNIGAQGTVGSPSAGILCLGASHGLISGVTVFRTLADAIHMTGATHDMVVEKNTILNPGDDMVAVVSYLANGSVCHDITIRENQCLGQTCGRGITVIGGDHVTIAHNRVENSVGGGIHCAAESSYMTFGATNITIEDNTLKNCDVFQKDSHGSIFIYGNVLTFEGKTTSYPAADIVIRGNKIIDSHCVGIRLGTNVHRTVVENNIIDGTQYEGIGISLWEPKSPGMGSGDIAVRLNKISRTGRNGIALDSAVEGPVAIEGNELSNIGAGAGANAAIFVSAGATGVRPLTIADNRFVRPAGSAAAFIDCKVSAASAGTSAAAMTSGNKNETDKPSSIVP